jgi:hypothetical protein
LKVNLFILWILVLAVLSALGFDLYNKTIAKRQCDRSDAPMYYGEAKHFFPDRGPYFGKIRGDNDLTAVPDSGVQSFAIFDDKLGQNDEDGLEIAVFNNADTNFLNIPELTVVETAYNLKVAVNGAKIGDPIRGWIDFNGNGKFETTEKASTLYSGGSHEILSWPANNAIATKLTYLRLRICEKIYQDEIETPIGATQTGEVEDYAIRIITPIFDDGSEKLIADFTPFTNEASYTVLKTYLQNFTIGNIPLKITFSKKLPDVLGINNKHDINNIGIRVGHSEENIMDSQNPMQIGMKLTESRFNFSFTMADIDAGDRVKIEGFRGGNKVPFKINNLTEYFFYQFNEETQEIYGAPNADAGGDSHIPNSNDMGIFIKFTNAIDSVSLTYTDDAIKTSGTFTISKISFRKQNMAPALIENFNYQLGQEKQLSLNWQITNSANLKQFEIQRSFDGYTFETLSNASVTKTNDLYNFIDNSLPISSPNCYYRIKTIELDNFTSLSPKYLIKRRKTASDYGFKPTNNKITEFIEFELLVDIDGPLEISISDYNGKKLSYMLERELGKKGDKIKLANLDTLKRGVYYFELKVKKTQKTFLCEGYKD